MNFVLNEKLKVAVITLHHKISLTLRVTSLLKKVVLGH